MLPVRTILHPTDFSEFAHNAFELACGLARDYKAEIVVLHVVAPPVAVYGDGMVPFDPEAEEQQARERLNTIRPPEPQMPVRHRLAGGDPGSEILRAAEETGCDLVVMGTHGRTGLSRFFMGSV